MTPRAQYNIRKAHRYLGVLLGLQFLLWTSSGLYFSWTNIDDIHGDLQHRRPPLLSASFKFVSLDTVFNNLPEKADSIQQIELATILQKPYYSIRYFSGSKLTTILADAQTGRLRQPIDKEEAIQIAAESFNGEPKIDTVQYITSVGKNDEYREKPLPAWKISFRHFSNTNVYVSLQKGKVESFRNRKWRTYDLLWMFHTMDYNGRDNLNNWVLRAFSIFGLLTVTSGFLLFWISSKWFRKRKTVR